jgi:uncharacterized membrane protein
MAENDENVMDEVSGDSSGGGSAVDSVRSSLMSKEILIPAALTAGAALAATKGPDLMRNLGSNVQKKSQDQAEQLGEKSAEGAKKALTGGKGPSGMLGKVASATVGKLGGGGGGGPKGKTRRLPIQRWTDVAVPVEVAYREWTNFEEFPKFMHRVLSVNTDDDNGNKVKWEEKIWFSKRQWEGEVTDRRKNDRIAWKTKSGMQHAGIVSFHQIGPRLTRVMVTMDFVPQGMFEKMGSGMRFVKRAVQADLARFKAQVEMKDAKGLEYRSGSDDQKEEKREEKKEEEKKQTAERKQNGGDSRSERSQGDGDDDDERSNDDREEERRERESRRRERRETVSS